MKEKLQIVKLLHSVSDWSNDGWI